MVAKEVEPLIDFVQRVYSSDLIDCKILGHHSLSAEGSIATLGTE